MSTFIVIISLHCSFLGLQENVIVSFLYELVGVIEISLKALSANFHFRVHGENFSRHEDKLTKVKIILLTVLLLYFVFPF